MKRFLVVGLVFFCSSLLKASAVNDLEQAIRKSDVNEVQHILADLDILSLNEAVRLISAAAQVEGYRAHWSEMSFRTDFDFSTENHKQHLKIALEFMTAFPVMLGGLWLSEKKPYLGFLSAASGFMLLFKAVYDQLLDDAEARLILRKKYQDAITIHQLITSIQSV